LEHFSEPVIAAVDRGFLLKIFTKFVVDVISGKGSSFAKPPYGVKRRPADIVLVHAHVVNARKVAKNENMRSIREVIVFFLRPVVPAGHHRVCLCNFQMRGEIDAPRLAGGEVDSREIWPFIEKLVARL
jgi:hypothetical protein